MKNLREEIRTILLTNTDTEISNYITGEILSMIEKRIDSLLDDVKKEREYAFRNDFNELVRETAHAQHYIGKVKEILK